MSDPIAPARFHELGWRVLAYAACTHFRTGSLAEGLKLAAAIGTLSETSSQRPDIDIRASGVTVRLKVNERGELSEADVESHDEFVGPAYGAATPAGLAAMKLAARTEGLLLDPVYTGKAMAGLIEQARAGLLGPASVVVFIHTGGLPAIFAYKDEILAAL